MDMFIFIYMFISPMHVTSNAPAASHTTGRIVRRQTSFLSSCAPFLDQFNFGYEISEAETKYAH